MARSVYDAVQNLLSTKARPTPAAPGSSTNIDITGYDDNGQPQFKLPNQRSSNMPSQLFKQLMSQSEDKGYSNSKIWPYETPDSQQATQNAIKEAISVTTSAPAMQKQAQAAAVKVDENRPKGRAATLLTGGQGLLSQPNISRRSLLGF